MATDTSADTDRLEWVPAHRGEVATSRFKWADTSISLFAAVVPFGYRRAHRAYAALTRRFWIPCPLCSRMFGGHEWADGERIDEAGKLVEVLPATVPIADDEREGDQFGAAICPRCTCARAGEMAWVCRVAQLTGRPAPLDDGEAAAAASPVPQGSRLATAAEIDDHVRPPYDTDERLDDKGVSE